jgi:hypothetical protein
VTKVQPSAGRSSWAEFALVVAAATVLLTTALSIVRVPAGIAGFTLMGIGPALADTDKAWVLLVWLCAAASVAIVLLLDRRARRGAISRVAARALSLASVVAFVLALFLAVWTNPPTTTWAGFGILPVLVGSVIAAALLIFVLSRRLPTRLLTWVSVVGTVVVSIAALVQTPSTFAWNNGYDNQFTVDEILAASTGRMPGFDYIDQYESLLGFPLALARLVVPRLFSAHPEAFGVGWLVILQVATLVIAIIAVMRVAPRRLRWLVPIIVVPVAYLVGAAGLEYYADLPMRFILPTLLLAVFAWIGMRRIGRPIAWWAVAIPGVVGGAAAFNNLDFGVPALLAGLAAVALAPKKFWSMVRAGIVYLLAALTVPAVYLLVGYLSGRTFHASYFLFFVTSFGVDGHLNVDMPFFGLHTSFVFLGVVGLALGVLGLRRRTGRTRVLSQLLVFQSGWLLLSLVYFSGRSLTPTLITGSCFLVGTVLALLLMVGYPYFRLLRRSGYRQWARADWMVVILVVVSLALPIAAIGSFPSPKGSVERIASGVGSSGVPPFMQPDPTKAVAKVPSGVRLMGILGVSGSVWSMKLGVPNANVFLHPDYTAFPTGADTECAFMSARAGDALVTTATELAILRQSSVCRGLLDFAGASRLAKSPSVSTGTVQWMLVPRR